MSTYETARLADVRREDGWAPIRLALGVRAFGVNGWTGREDGDVVIPEHDEVPTGHEELYVVVSGHATFTVAGDEVDATTGTIVFVRDPSAKRGAVAREPDTTVLSVGAKAGEAFTPQPWETNRDVFALLDAGKALEGNPSFAAYLPEDKDLASLRDDPRFAELLS